MITLDIKAILYFAALAAGVYFLTLVPTAIFIFLTGFLLYVILNPLISFLTRWYSSRGLWVTVVLVVSGLVFALAMLWITPLVITEISSFTQKLPQYIDGIKQLVGKYEGERLSQDAFGKAVRSGIEQSLSQLGNILSSAAGNSLQFILRLAGNLFNFLLAAIVAVYLLIDEERIGKFFNEVLPPRFLALKKELWGEILASLAAYFRGLIWLAFLLFALCWIGFLILGLNFSFLLALWVGVTVIIPYLGPFIGSIPAIVIAFLQSTNLGIAVTVLLVILQFIIANVVGPRILSKSTGIHPIAVVLAIVAGGELRGMVGMILAVPVVATIFLLLKYYWPEAAGGD